MSEAAGSGVLDPEEEVLYPVKDPDRKLLRPLLKWAGGKSALVPRLIPLWEGEPWRRLVEPFCGALNVALGIDPARATLNDNNPHLINLFQQIKSGRLKKLLWTPEHNRESTFYQKRDRFNACINEKRENTEVAAQLYFYLCRHAYNGLSRFNASGLFNAPYGHYKTVKLDFNLNAYREQFLCWDFTSADFEQVPVAKDCWVYLDPPYDVEFVGYTAGGFSWDDQVRLARWASKLPCPVIASNAATDRIVELWQDFGFRVDFIELPTRISCKPGSRGMRKEILAFSEELA